MAGRPIDTSEYLRTPETLLPQELVYGYVREAAAPSAAHQRTVGALFIRLSQHLRDTGAGEVWLSPLDVVLDVERDLVVQPDLSVVLAEHADIVTDRIWGAPDLVVEVMSPRPRIGLPTEATTEMRAVAKVGNVEERLEWFARYGVRECWLVQLPGSQVEIIRFQRGVIVSTVFGPLDAIKSSVLPGIRLTPLDVMST
jgi:Uma2 family endonuclease